MVGEKISRVSTLVCEVGVHRGVSSYEGVDFMNMEPAWKVCCYHARGEKSTAINGTRWISVSMLHILCERRRKNAVSAPSPPMFSLRWAMEEMAAFFRLCLEPERSSGVVATVRWSCLSL